MGNIPVWICNDNMEGKRIAAARYLNILKSYLLAIVTSMSIIKTG